MSKTVNYPVIATKHKNIWMVSSPNIPGMHTEGSGLFEAWFQSIDAIETALILKKWTIFIQSVK